MSHIEYKRVKISDICTPAKADKTLTRSKAKDKEGAYPVYAATIGEVFAYINDYNNSSPCLVVVNDGDAGNTYIVKDSMYSIGKHATGLIPNAGIDLEYLQKVATPVFQSIAKGYGLGNLPKADILDAEVSIPIKENGSFDLEKQIELSNIYTQIEELRQVLLQKLWELKDIHVRFPKEPNTCWKEVHVADLFIPKGGNMSYSKEWAKKHSGSYPLYSGTTSGVYDLVSIADYDGEYLSWCIDGLAGYVMYHNEAFSVTCHRGVLVPREDVDFSRISLKYLKYIFEPIFRKRKKGREGDLGKNEYTSLKPIAIKTMKDTFPIPVADDGYFDLEKQLELANKYEQIEIIKSELSERITELADIVVA